MELQKSWQLRQLQALSHSRPDRIATALETLFESHPDVHCDVVIGGLQDEAISVEEAASELNVNFEQLETLRQEYLDRNRMLEHPEIEHHQNRPATLVGNGLAVWEVVREYRRSACSDTFRAALPSVSKAQLEASLAYASTHKDEIDELIRQYESFKSIRTSEYPRLA